MDNRVKSGAVAATKQGKAQGILKEKSDGLIAFVYFVAQQVLRRITLNIQVNYQGALALHGTDGGQITGDGAFANAPFLIKYNSSHVIPPVNALILPYSIR